MNPDSYGGLFFGRSVGLNDLSLRSRNSSTVCRLISRTSLEEKIDESDSVGFNHIKSVSPSPTRRIVFYLKSFYCRLCRAVGPLQIAMFCSNKLTDYQSILIFRYCAGTGLLLPYSRAGLARPT